jgi:hypothetical protein
LGEPQIQTLVANALGGGGGATAETLGLGAGFYDTLSRELQFDDRYRRAYVVGPAIQWSNDAGLTSLTSLTVLTRYLWLHLWLTLGRPLYDPSWASA